MCLFLGDLHKVFFVLFLFSLHKHGLVLQAFRPPVTMVVFRNFQWGAEKRNTTLRLRSDGSVLLQWDKGLSSSCGCGRASERRASRVCNKSSTANVTAGACTVAVQSEGGFRKARFERLLA